jgi:NAD(P)-dependent dehydrogenase (short-subunit alcohol dehydrogenase family)
MFDLTGKTALITGASGGIGGEIARALHNAGATVGLSGTRTEPLEALAAELGDRAHVLPCNLSDPEAVAALPKQASDAMGSVDILVNNAGISGGSYPPVTENEKADWEKILGVNLIGAMLMIKHVAPHMQERQQGAIVNTASVAGIRSGAGGNPYSASKAGVINLTQTAACDLGGYNVRVNAVCPGLVETGMTKAVFDYARANEKEHKLGSRCELRRYGRPEELAAAICFLASDDASYITGQALPVDGGNTASLNMPGMKV